ncbi:MAG: nucleotidyltransferase domain-containing protein [Oligoflexia bacterium]|nr:nucleotidyltransferase domain-containing protein [Oligoflexia bacterium]MBF0366780.1 nucleotidyltransferase domain-containing protein [Oligoflexia bacterium]
MKTIVKKKKNFLRDKSKEEFVKELIDLLQGQVVEAYIFGSFFTNSFHGDSDLDLILINNTSEEFCKRPLQYPQLYELQIPIDILVYTPEEFKNIREEEHVGFWKDVFKSAKRII